MAECCLVVPQSPEVSLLSMWTHVKLCYVLAGLQTSSVSVRCIQVQLVDPGAMAPVCSRCT